MKQIRKICMFAALVAALAFSVFAQQDNLKVSNATAKKGELIYLTLELTQPTEGNTVSVKYSYDDKLLKPVVESCKWVQEGFMMNFDKANPAGVWSVQNATQLKGGLCVLAFELRDGAEFTKTEVACEVKVNNGGQNVGVYHATAKVILECVHSYGQWEDAGNLGHTQTCTLCQGQHTQSHTWDQGKQSQTNAPGKVETLYTCTVCGGTKTVTQNKEQEILPTFSKPTEEKDDQPTQAPTQSQGPLTPTMNPQDEIPELTEPTQTKPVGSTGSHTPEIDHTKSTVPSHSHDHDPVMEPEDRSDSILTGAVVAIVIVAMVTAAVLIVKKKRK